jgi:proline iminopeptidase
MQTDSYTNQELTIDVGSGHKLYVYDWGCKTAEVPFIFLHGGPGGSIKDKYKSIFDPRIHRVIFFNQRGSGLSTPLGTLENNTTDDLVSDISKIADELQIEKFNLHGTSWGSTLALAYAIAHPERVASLVIGGVFTGSQSEIDWLTHGKFKTYYPDIWQDYLDRTPEQHRDDPSAYHFDKAFNGSPEEQKASCYAYECLEGGVVRLDDRSAPDDYATYDPTGIRIEMHYVRNNCFMPDRYILENCDKLTMPVFIVQGRYDMVCPPITAYELHKKIKHSQLYWTLSGHAVDHEGENVFRSIVAQM